MIDLGRKIRVSDMPDEVKGACLERDYGLDDKMSIYQAMAEWTAWNIGSKQWGYSAAEHVADMAELTLEPAQ